MDSIFRLYPDQAMEPVDPPSPGSIERTLSVLPSRLPSHIRALVAMHRDDGFSLIDQNPNLGL